MDEVNPAQPLKVEQLPHLHAVTKAVSEFCQNQLLSYLEAMAPLFRPRRLLGDHIEGNSRESVVGVDQNLAQLRELYKRVATGPPFDLKEEFSTPLESVSSQMQLHAWQYLYEARTSHGDLKQVTVTSPLTWVLCYPSNYSPQLLRQVVAGKQKRDKDGIRNFVLRACLLNLLFTKYPALTDLLGGLRYRVEVRRSPQLGDLPLVTVTAPVSSMRPGDDLLLLAAGLSGGMSFEEILDLEAVRRKPDPLREQISSILSVHGESL